MDIQSILKQGHKVIKRKKWDSFIDFNTFDIDKLSSDDLRAKDWEYNDEIIVEPVFEKNWSYKITDPNHPKCGETLWSGRYCAVTGIVIKQMQNDIMKSYEEMIDKLIKELEDGKDLVSNQK